MYAVYLYKLFMDSRTKLRRVIVFSLWERCIAIIYFQLVLGIFWRLNTLVAEPRIWLILEMVKCSHYYLTERND